MRNKPRFLLSAKSLTKRLIFLAVPLLYLSCANEEKAQRPNIVLIMTDQQHGSMMSAAGNQDVQTPAMDLLAAEGIRFSNAYCTSPVCGPARSSIITGLMPHQTDVEWNGDRIHDGIRNLGERLQEVGYETYWGGKWHLPDSYPQRDSTKTIVGFELLDIPLPRDSRWFLGAETDPALTTSAVNFLNTYDQEDPFFLAVSYHNPHDICMYSRKFGWFTPFDSLLEIRYYGFEHKLPDVVGMHPSEVDQLPALPFNHPLPNNEPAFIMEKRLNHLEYGIETKLSYGEFGDLEWQGYLNAYNRLTEMVDQEILKVIESLKANGLWENIIIIFTSDHGDGAAAHKWAAKLSLYEEPSSIPMILYDPGMKRKGAVSHQLVSQIDITPTLLDYAGIEIADTLPGQSLKTLLKDNEPWRDALVVELADFKRDKSRKGRMLRTGDFKYNLFSTYEEQLFNLAEDPGELKDLSRLEAYKEMKLKLRKMLQQWAVDTNDDFTLGLLSTPDQLP